MCYKYLSTQESGRTTVGLAIEVSNSVVEGIKSGAFMGGVLGAFCFLMVLIGLFVATLRKLRLDEHHKVALVALVVWALMVLNGTAIGGMIGAYHTGQSPIRTTGVLAAGASTLYVLAVLVAGFLRPRRSRLLLIHVNWLALPVALATYIFFF